MAQIKKIGQPLVRTAKVKLLKGVVLGPGEIGHEGDIYEVPKYQATELIGHGLAEYTDEGAPSENDDPGAAAHREGYATVTMEGVTDRDPRPKRK
jgi:hypothetical protein